MLTTRLPVLLAISVMLILSGCTSWTRHGVSIGVDKKFRIAVLPIDVTAEITKLSGIMTTSPKGGDEEQLIREQMQDTAGELDVLLNARLNESDYIEPVAVGCSGKGAPSPVCPIPLVWTEQELRTLKTSQQVEAVLQVKLAGYGKLEKKWLTFLIGTGVIEGIVQGVVAAKVVDNTWVGIAVGLEEIGQEILVWGGGSYFFNRHYSPVTLEVQLISTKDSETIWDDTVFVSIDKDAVALLAEEDRNKKELQLKLTAKKAVNELVDDLNKKARNQGVRVLDRN